jgi:hypothetical protein
MTKSFKDKSWFGRVLDAPFIAIGFLVSPSAWFATGQWLTDQFSYYTTMTAYRGLLGLKSGVRKLDEIALRSGVKLKMEQKKEVFQQTFENYRDNSPQVEATLQACKKTATLAIATVMLPFTAYQAGRNYKNKVIAGIKQRRQDSIDRSTAALEAQRQRNTPEGRLQSKVEVLQQGLENLQLDNRDFAYSIRHDQHPQTGAPVAKIFTSLQDAQGEQIIFRVGADKIEMGSGGAVTKVFRSASKAMEHIRAAAPRERVEPHF